MRKKTWLIVLILAVFVVPMYAQTVDEIVAKNIQARGGLDKLKKVNTIRVSGRMVVGPGIEAPMVIEQKRPNQMRLEFTIQGMTASQGFDGKSGWSIMPFGGVKDPQPMSEDDRKTIDEQADFDGPLVDYKAKGNKVELLGKEPLEGTDTYKLQVTLKDGSVRTFYLDADSFLEIKQEGKRTIRGTVVEGESLLGDYKEVEGLMMPFSIEAGTKGSPQRQKITIDKVEINPTLDDSRFKMPEVKKEEPKPEDKKAKP
ncbi:MAG: outer membrane lipoprotein-sorting protein [Acidobacteriia bacterium]|nr:outer membrane lipoprotein-sorting protein [Terriglobia bacterium]